MLDKLCKTKCGLPALWFWALLEDTSEILTVSRGKNTVFLLSWKINSEFFKNWMFQIIMKTTYLFFGSHIFIQFFFFLIWIFAIPSPDNHPTILLDISCLADLKRINFYCHYIIIDSKFILLITKKKSLSVMTRWTGLASVLIHVSSCLEISLYKNLRHTCLWVPWNLKDLEGFGNTLFHLGK